MGTFGTSSASIEPKIKQEIQDTNSISNVLPGNSSQILPLRQKLDLVKPNDTIEYMDDSNIQGKNHLNFINRMEFLEFFFYFNFTVVNVYTTHMPEISSTLPSIIMQDEASILNSSTTSTDHLSSYSLIGDDLIKHSFSDDGCSSGDQSDVEIDL